MLLSSAFAFAAPSFGLADAPQVVTDVAPIHGLVARVMDGVGEPDLLVPPGTSPHYFNLRPSDARALENAELFVTVGPSLAPWLERIEQMTSSGSETIELLEIPGTTLFAYRDNVALAEDEHDHGDEGHDDHDDHEDHGDDHADEHDHDDHDDHEEDHADEHGHDDHDDDHADSHGHDDHDDDHSDAHDHDDHSDDHADKHEHDDHGDDHAEEDGHDDHDHTGGSDPHAWLAPANAAVWVEAIAEKLAEIDPDHADLYRSNATEAKAEFASLTDEIKARFDAMEERGFFVLHDAYQYFEDTFGLTPEAAISDGDAVSPGAARLRELRQKVATGTVGCVFTEPQLSRRVVDTVVEGTDLEVVEIDPLGADAPAGADHYPALLRAMADSFEACFK